MLFTLSYTQNTKVDYEGTAQNFIMSNAVVLIVNSGFKALSYKTIQEMLLFCKVINIF
jgi:hypothetical protein